MQLTLLEHRDRGLSHLQRSLEATPLAELPFWDRPYLFVASTYARAQRPDRARAILAEWQANIPAHLRRVEEPWYQGVLGDLALSEGRWGDALQAYRRAHEGSTCPICFLPAIGEAYDRAGQPDSAVAVYERYLATPHIHRLWSDSERLAPTHERLAQLYEARGDRRKAAEHYARFVELWREADPELQPRVREAERRLAALR